MSILLHGESLSKSFGAKPLFEGVSVDVSSGERLGLIGPNGGGKSTLLKLLADLETPDTGEVTRRRTLRLGHVPQTETFEPDQSLREVVMNTLVDLEPDEQQRRVSADIALSRAGFDDPDRPAGELSGGWGKRLAIARQWAREPDVMLMDEPTNHLDLEGVLWLEKMLKGAPFALVVVTHDRYLLQAVATRIIELSRTYPEGTLSVQGDYATFLRRRAEFLEAQQREQRSLASKVRQDIAWLNQGVKARATRSKSRLDAAKQRQANLSDLKDRNAPDAAADIAFEATGRKTQKLIETTGLKKAIGGRELIGGLDLVLSPGSTLGLLGTNGAGKTTLINLLNGSLEPDAGTVRHAPSLRVITFTQQREELDPTQTLWRALCPDSDTVYYQGRPIHVAGWAERFLFRKEQLKVAVGDLSGGERARILLARLMLRPADVLLLDEPTNDLDIPSLEVLERSIEEFNGAVVLVTHDRFMLQRLATRVLGLGEPGGAKLYPDYNQWEQAQRPATGPAPAGAGSGNGNADGAKGRNEKGRGKQGQSGGRSASTSSSAAASGSTQTAEPKKKLTYKEQIEYREIEDRIMEAEEEAKEWEQRLADPAVQADHEKLDEACNALAEAHKRVNQLYERWEELEARQ